MLNCTIELYASMSKIYSSRGGWDLIMKYLGRQMKTYFKTKKHLITKMVISGKQSRHCDRYKALKSQIEDLFQWQNSQLTIE